MKKYFSFLDTAKSSWAFLVKHPLVQDITVFDFGMQVASFQFWSLYLFYTACRCGILLVRYCFSDNKAQIWKQAQLYSSTKVAGIVVSQIFLVLLGISSIPWALCVLGWGAVLMTASTFAKLQAHEL